MDEMRERLPSSSLKLKGWGLVLKCCRYLFFLNKGFVPRGLTPGWLNTGRQPIDAERDLDVDVCVGAAQASQSPGFTYERHSRVISQPTSR
jgi:hypothetical protein